MEKGFELVMNWTGYVATIVMGPRLVSLCTDNFSPLNRMSKVWKEGIVSMDGILELPKQNRFLLPNTLLPLVNNLDSAAKRNKMQDYLACMKHEQVMHTHSSRCIHVRMGKGDNYDCAGGFKPCPSNQTKHISDTDLKQLSLQRDRTNLICHHVAIFLLLQININFIIVGDKSARQPNNP